MAETSTIFGFMKYVSATDILSDFKKTVDSHFVNSLRLFKSIIKQSFYIFKPRSYNLLSCFFEKPWYIEGDEGVHCGTQSGGIRPSSFFIYLKRSKLLVL